MNRLGRQLNRVEYIDIAKAIAIFCVVVGHTVDSNTMIKTVLYAFHMPVFFVLSGMVAEKKAQYSLGSFKKFILKRAKLLIIPYVLWGCIYAKFSFKNLLFIAWGTRETLICADSLTSLWFLPVSFVSGMLLEGIFWLCNQKYNLWRIVLIGAVCFIIGAFIPHWNKYGNIWGSDIAFIATSLMVIGYMVRPIFDKLQKAKCRTICLVVILGLILLVVGIKFNSICFENSQGLFTPGVTRSYGDLQVIRDLLFAVLMPEFEY